MPTSGHPGEKKKVPFKGSGVERLSSSDAGRIEPPGELESRLLHEHIQQMSSSDACCQGESKPKHGGKRPGSREAVTKFYDDPAGRVVDEKEAVGYASQIV